MVDQYQWDPMGLFISHHIPSGPTFDHGNPWHLQEALRCSRSAQIWGQMPWQRLLVSFVCTCGLNMISKYQQISANRWRYWSSFYISFMEVFLDVHSALHKCVQHFLDSCRHCSRLQRSVALIIKYINADLGATESHRGQKLQISVDVT